MGDGESNRGEGRHSHIARDERDYMNENSGSSCRDSCDDHDLDQEMKDFSHHHHQEEMDEDNDENESQEEKRKDNQRDSAIIRKRNDDQVVEENAEDGEIKVVIKEEHDEDFISVDVELSECNTTTNTNSGGNVNLSRSPSDILTHEGESCNNNEQPKDLSSGKVSSQPEVENSSKKNESDDDNKKDSSRTSTGTARVLYPKSRHPQQILEQQHVQMGDGSNSSSPSISPRSSPGLSSNHPYDFSGAPSMVGRFHPFFVDHPFMAYRHFNSFNFGQNFPGSNGPEGHSSSSPSGYEAALGLVGRNKGGGGQNHHYHPSSGKPSPGLEAFHDFQNGIPPLQGRGGGGGSGGMVGSGAGGASVGDHLSRIRGEDLFASRSASSAELISSIINSNRGDLGLSPLNLGSHHQNPNSLALDERRKRNRTFIDPVTEVPRLEQWFTLNTHPSHNLILKYTEELNRMPYRQKFPKLEPKNVQFWFKVCNLILIKILIIADVRNDDNFLLF